jgi:hypothetical protein
MIKEAGDMGRTARTLDGRAARDGLARAAIAATLVGLLALALTSSAGAAPISDAELFAQFPPAPAAEGSAAGQLDIPGAVATDPVTGHVIVVSNSSKGAGDARINEFTPWGEFVKAFGQDVAPGAVNEVQEVRIRASDGEFALSQDGSATPSLPFDATAQEVEVALENLPSIGAGNVAVEERKGAPSGVTPYIFAVTFKGALAATDVSQLVAADGSTPLGGGEPSTEMEVRTRVDGAAAGVGPEACTAESACQAGVVGSLGGQLLYPTGVAVDAAGDVYVLEALESEGRLADGAKRSSLRVQKFDPAGRFLLAFGGDVITDGAAGTGDLVAGSSTVTGVQTTSRVFEVGQQVAGPGIPSGATIAAVGVETITLSASATASGTNVAFTAPEGAGNVPTNERQTISLAAPGGGAPSGGDFELTFTVPEPSPSSATTQKLPYDATAGLVEGELEGLSNLGAGNVAVTGPAGGPWVVEFKGARFADTDVEQLEVKSNGLSPSGSTARVTSTNAAEVCHVATDCRLGAPGTTNGQLGYMSPYLRGEDALAVASDGTVYVGDVGRVQEFNPDGSYKGALALPAEANPGNLDIGEDGSIYFDYNYLNYNFSIQYPRMPDVLRLDPATGLVLGQLSVRRPAGIASHDGTVFVENDPNGDGRIMQFGESGEQVGECCTLPPKPGSNSQNFTGAGIAANATGVVYRALFYGGAAFAQGYGSAPGLLTLESPPQVAPDIDAEFASSVRSEHALVKAQINPHYWTDATYYVQYGTEECSTGACVSTPAPPGRGLTEQAVSRDVTTAAVSLEGLEPSTTYHYRFVAVSSGGGPTYGEDRTFTTFPSSTTSAGHCPNPQFRTGASADLPDCRAYEMVSPPDKANGDILSLQTINAWLTGLYQSAPGGDRITYSSYQAFGDAVGAPYAGQYLATRDPVEGWRSSSLAPPRQGATLLGSGGMQIWREFTAFTGDLSSAWLLYPFNPPLTADAPRGYPNLYRRDNGDGSFETLSAYQPTVHGPELYVPELQGYSADGRRAVFRINEKLAVAGGVQPSGAGNWQLYEAIGNGRLRLVSVLPDGQASTENSSAGTANGAPYGGGQSLANAVSADGSRIYWTTTAGTSGGEQVLGSGSGRIFLRANGRNPTVPVSETVTAEPAQFQGASVDGAFAYFLVEQTGSGQLADSSLYRFDATSGSSEPVAGRMVGAVVGISDDGSRAYFVSREDLAAGATDGEPNLYLFDADASGASRYRFVAKLAEEDASAAVAGPVTPVPVQHAAAVSSDGGALTFTAVGSLTGYENVDAESGQLDTEVFQYRASADGGHGALRCVSCNPTGARPSGRLWPSPLKTWRGRWMSAWLTTPLTDLYAPRVIADHGGRVFFNSYERLVPEDHNDAVDVYEWTEPGAGDCTQGSPSYSAPNGGCLALISAGAVGVVGSSEFVDATPSGGDAFFTTPVGLVAQDHGAIDLYDARVDGGFPAEAGPRAECEGEACQSPAGPPPAAATPGTTLARPGNGTRPVRCRKGQVRRRGKCACPPHKKVRKGRCVKGKRRHHRRHGHHHPGKRAHDHRRAGR